MTEKYDIICLSSTAWTAVYGSRQQIMSRMAKAGHRVLFVESEPSWKELFSGLKGIKKLVAALSMSLKDSVEFKKNLYLYSLPPLVPKRTFRLINSVNTKISVFLVKRQLKKLGLSEPVIWTFQPWNAGYKNALKEKLFVYHCIDNFLGGIKKESRAYKSIAFLEEKQIICSDLIFVGSEMLLKEDRFKYDKVVLLNTGVDYEHYAKAVSDSISIPEELKNIPSPVLAYIGSINAAKLDFSLLEQVVVRFNKSSLVLIGPVRQNAEKYLKKLSEYKNFFFLGHKDIQELPNYLKKVDICLLPYKLNEMVKYIFPMKIYEYLAAEKPVIATRWQGTEQFEDVLELVSSDEEFLKAVESIITRGYDKNRILEGSRMARQNDWNNRMRTIDIALRRYLH